MTAIYTGIQAEKYIAFADNSYSWKYVEKPSIEQNLGKIITAQTRILDFGFGTGRSTKALLELGAKEEKIIGVDNSKEMIKVGTNNFPKIGLLHSDGKDLIFPKNSFDLIFSCMVLHYINQKDYEELIKKFAHWLAKGGILFFNVIHPLRYPENHGKYFEPQEKLEPTPWGTQVGLFPKTFTGHVTPILKNGFEIIALEETVPVLDGKKESLEQFRKYESAPTRLTIIARKK